MSESRQERRDAARAQRVAHLAGSINLYLLLATAGLVLFVVLHAGYVPGTEWHGWSYGVIVSAIMLGFLLIWISEHRRKA
jgi:hypothetical protein